MSKSNLSQAFESARIKLLYAQPLYALVLQRCLIRWAPEVETAGVRPNSQGSVELSVAPDFFNSLSELHRVGLLMHEMLHLFMDHFTRGKQLDQRVANVAMDLAINQFIPSQYLPPGALLPQDFSLPKGESFEFYYERLLQSSESNDSETLDNHDWSRGFESNGDATLPPELQRRAIESVLQSAVKECDSSFRGRIPNQLNRLIESIFSTPKLNWRQELRRFIGRERSKQNESTRTRPNRRMGFKAQGTKPAYFPKILVGIDQSGSVDESKNAAFLSELREILKNAEGATEVAFFDTEIAQRLTLRKANDVPSKRFANGGTSFDCIFNFARESRPDLIIMLTDGEASAPTQISIPILWVIKGRCTGEHLPGIKVNLTE